jgi:hypothetical protein
MIFLSKCRKEQYATWSSHGGTDRRLIELGSAGTCRTSHSEVALASFRYNALSIPITSHWSLA